ncbi:hypothetical protein ACF06V_38380 [Streptomyces bobili]
MTHTPHIVPTQPDESIAITARAWSLKGRLPVRAQVEWAPS